MKKLSTLKTLQNNFKQVVKNRMKNLIRQTLPFVAMVGGLQTGFGQDHLTLTGLRPFELTNTGSGTYNMTGIYNNYSNGFLIDLAKTSDNIGATPIDFSINARGATHPFFKIVGSTGNVGIGTLSPTQKLEVNGNIKGNHLMANVVSSEYLNVNYATLNSIYFSGNSFTWSAAHWRPVITSFLGSAWVSSNATPSGSSIGSGKYLSMGMTSSGWYFGASSSGVGGSDPVKYALVLTLDGQLRVPEILVTTTHWSDFVFEKNYNLPSLKEAEAHIKQFGHLKDIPSAAEVIEGGINLGDMDAKLLQKIEELMLYTIEQEKEIAELKTMNAELVSLKERLDILEAAN